MRNLVVSLFALFKTKKALHDLDPEGTSIEHGKER